MKNLDYEKALKTVMSENTRMYSLSTVAKIFGMCDSRFWILFKNGDIDIQMDIDPTRGVKKTYWIIEREKFICFLREKISKKKLLTESNK